MLTLDCAFHCGVWSGVKILGVIECCQHYNVIGCCLHYNVIECCLHNCFLTAGLLDIAI